MSRKLYSGVLGALLIVLAAALVPGPELFAGTARTENGKISTINPVKKLIGIRLSDGSPVALKIPPTARIKRNGARAALESLVLRDSAVVTFNATTGFATTVTTSGPKVVRGTGRVNSVLLASGLVRIGSKSYKTDANTRIARNGYVVSLGKLTRKDNVVVHTRPGTAKIPLALDIVGCGPAETETEGTIVGVDLVAGTVTIKPENGAADVTLTVNSSTMIELDDNAAALANLLVNMEAEAEYDPITLIAYRIEAETQEDEADIEGTVAAVDTTLGTITIDPEEGGAPVILTVNASTEIEVNDASAGLPDVAVGMPVRAEYDTLTLIATEIKAGEEHQDDDESESDIEGTVTAVTADSVTIAPDQGEDDDEDEDGEQDHAECTEPVTLIIDASTVICVGDAPGTIADILVGLKVEGEYDKATLIAEKIEIETDDDEDHEGDDD